MHRFNKILADFDAFLVSQKLAFEGTLIGGAALQLLGVTERVTKDCDIVEPIIPPEIAAAVCEFADRHSLSRNWFNNGPQSLLRDFASDWKEKRREIFRGRALLLFTLSQHDLLASKLFAYLDRGIDLDDICKLAPTLQEVDALMPWLRERDANIDWPDYVNIRIAELKEVLYGDSK